jgi:hypothetical protein
MKPTFVLALIIINSFAGGATERTIQRMPPALETRYALSALPSAMRDQATVYLLDPARGYRLSRQGSSGMTCLVERTAWEQADFRDDIYVPLCYDAAGTRTYLQVIMDAAALRAGGMGPAALKTEIETRYRDGTYAAPNKPGLSYMLAPVMRTWMMPDGKVHTMPMIHLMFYAPHLTDTDIAGVPALDPLRAFVFEEGIAQQRYMIVFAGESERARIMSDEKVLLGDLCAYRAVLCLPAAH